MLSMIPKHFGISLEYFINYCWNMSPTGTAPNRSHLYLYLPNGHANVVRYDDFLSNFKLWYPELASIIDMYYIIKVR